jgi:hypothetical protein
MASSSASASASASSSTVQQQQQSPRSKMCASITFPGSAWAYDVTHGWLTASSMQDLVELRNRKNAHLTAETASPPSELLSPPPSSLHPTATTTSAPSPTIITTPSSSRLHHVNSCCVHAAAHGVDPSSHS